MVEIDGIEYLTTSEVAQRFTVSRKTVRNWAYTGKLTSVHRAGIKEALFALPEVEALQRRITLGKGSKPK